MTTATNPPPPCPDCGIVHVAMASDIEVRDPDDEIVAHRVFVHIERMDDDRVWLGLTTADGRHVSIDFWSPSGAPVEMRVEDR